MINKKVDFSAQDEKGNTVAHWAAQNNYSDTINNLHRQKGNVSFLNHRNQTPLHLAFINKSEKVITLLLKHNIKVNVIDHQGNNELSYCAEMGDLMNTHKLLNKGVDINQSNHKGMSILDIAKKNKNDKLVDFLIGQGALSGKNYFNKIYQGDLKAIESILKKAPQFSKSYSNRSTSFQRILTTRNKKKLKELFELMLEYNDNINMPDTRGNTVLHSAADMKMHRTIKMLIGLRAECNVFNNMGQSPLHKLMNQKGSSAEATIEWLIEKGANVHHVDKQGYSCAEVCIRNDNAPVLQILLDQGFDVNGITSNKKTLLDYARTNKKRLCERLLLRQGGITHEKLLKKLDEVSKKI